MHCPEGKEIQFTCPGINTNKPVIQAYQFCCNATCCGLALKPARENFEEARRKFEGRKAPTVTEARLLEAALTIANGEVRAGNMWHGLCKAVREGRMQRTPEVTLS